MFQVASTIESISTRKDKTMKIVVGTQELAPEQMAALMTLHDKLGWFLFKENDITPDDIPKQQADAFKDEESPMISLQKTLWVYWDKCTNKSQPFNQFLRSWAEKKKDEIKDYLPK